MYIEHDARMLLCSCCTNQSENRSITPLFSLAVLIYAKIPMVFILHRSSIESFALLYDLAQTVKLNAFLLLLNKKN